MAPEGDEGRGRLRKARGSCQTSVDPGIPELAYAESIGICGQPGELKHLSTRRKGKQHCDSPSSGERKGISPNRQACLPGLWGPSHGVIKPPANRIRWKAEPQRVTVPYVKVERSPTVSPSRSGHVESGLNPGGPSPKAKYSLATDSEPSSASER